MTAEQWQRVKEVTADALEREPPLRAGFVAAACGDDPEVHREALRLVSEAEAWSDDFMTDPAARIWQVLGDQRLSEPYFSTGQTVAGRFEILQFLNRGGMGEVYAAMDLELREKVALKTIRPAIASSAEVIHRFKQEVRQTRRITHPNVCRVYDLFSHEPPSGKAVWFLTMELLEGRTLADRIAASGPLPMNQALPLIRDMVAALSAAHDLGIVHRDFKPNNVMLVPSGPTTERAVVTDFGLALPADSQSGDTAGTPAYMAPEQAADGNTSPAADQFSLGLVIAEVLTGKRPAPDRTPAAAARDQFESWLSSQSRSVLNWGARAAIARCLASRPQDRFRSVRDLVAVLDGSRQRKRTQWWIAGAAAAAMLAGLAAVAVGADWGDRVTDALRLTPATDYSTSPSLSRDGKWIAYSSNRAEAGNIDIWLDRARGGAARRLTTHPAQDGDPSISPDGGSVAFRSERENGGIYVVGADGAGEHLLVPGGRSPVFSPDGRLVAYWTGDLDDSVPSGQLYVTSPSGGLPRRLLPDFASARYPAWSSDGQYLVFEGCRANSQFFPACKEFWIVRADGRAVVNTGALAELQAENVELFSFTHRKAWRDDRILFGARRATIDALWEMTISRKDMRIIGKPRQVTSGEGREYEPTLAAAGAIAFGRLSGALHVWRIALDPAGGPLSGPAHASKLTDAPFGECCPAASSDGRWLFFTRRIHNAKDLFRKDLVTGAESVVLASPEEKSWPVPNLDGSKVAFESRRGNEFSVELIVQDRPARTLCSGCAHPTSWFGDKEILYTSPTGGIALLNIDTGVSRTVLAGAEGMTLGEADWSPENEYMLFTAGTNGASKQVYAVRFPEATGSVEGPWLLLTPEPHGAERPRWASGGKTFFYLSNRDGYLCVWGRRFVLGEKAPLDTPFPIMHYHDYPRFSPSLAVPVSRGLSVAGNSILLNVGEAIETVWAGALGPPSAASIIRDRLVPRISQ